MFMYMGLATLVYMCGCPGMGLDQIVGVVGVGALNLVTMVCKVIG